MMAVPPEDAGLAIRFAVLGAAAELTAKSLLLRRLGDIAEPYRSGRPGKLMQIAEDLTAARLARALLGGHTRLAAGAVRHRTGGILRADPARHLRGRDGVRSRPGVHGPAATRAPRREGA